MATPNPSARRALLSELLATEDCVPFLLRATEATPTLLAAAAAGTDVLSEAQWSELLTGLGYEPDRLPPTVPEQALVSLREYVRGHRDGQGLRATRSANLAVLVKPHGAQARLAALMGVTTPVISGMLRVEKKRFGKQAARKVESTLDLPEGWLDRDNPEPPEHVAALLDPTVKKKPKLLRREPVPVNTPSARESPALPGIHGVVESSYRDLVEQGKVSDRFAHELLGKLLELAES